MNNKLQELNLRLASFGANSLQRGIKHLFTDDVNRVSKYSCDLQGFSVDFSKSHLNDDVVQSYIDLAELTGFKALQQGLFSGQKINTSENRAVLHTALRSGFVDSKLSLLPQLPSKEDQESKDAYLDFIKMIERLTEELSSRQTKVKNIIHVGIGGSALGTQLLFDALKANGTNINIHFIGNIDAHQLTRILSNCQPDSTLIFGVSKTFGTAETLQNLDSIGEWFVRKGGTDFLANLIAVTANYENAIQYGIYEDNIAIFPEWVGGRYSVWSAVSLSAALVLGQDSMKEFLTGAANVDEYFYNTPLAQNACFIAAALDHYNVNYLGFSSKAVFAYDSRLRYLVDYLQQLETESNGKNIQKSGNKIQMKTSPVVWGGVGTDVQHSVFQLLHQGTEPIPAEFILVANADHELDQHHSELLANGLAQTAALLEGQTFDEVKSIHSNEGLSETALRAKVFEGDRPSTSIVMKKLEARSLGALLAFYEHRTFSFGALCEINSYDQMGVELGKRLAKSIRPVIDEINHTEGREQVVEIIEALKVDASTKNLLRKIYLDMQ